ncbi:Q-cell neuroblast polarization family protein [Cryptosporidium meleagridis]|uniref:Q-cell neuroblast polarization family protein n=1 Tax=Cryptosporidium meleagridis TaxID=93969 RepID=A0A2P4YX84_9CRYT|nr:Q-cell neuroblast polarization family protein [Cryptosporidium meleagridis]
MKLSIFLIKTLFVIVKGKTITLPLYGNVHKYGYYFIKVNVGFPISQQQTLIIDTGSSLTGFACSGCINCGTHENKPFNINLSATSNIINCKGNSTQNNKIDIINKSIYKGIEGSRILGYFFEDFVEFENELSSSFENKQKFENKFVFGCNIIENNFFKFQKASGIIGLANFGNKEMNQIINYIFKGGEVRKTDIDKIISIFFERDGGKITFGSTCFDQTKMMDYPFENYNITRCINDERYCAYISKIEVDLNTPELDTKLNENLFKAIFDTGTTISIFPARLFKKIIRGLFNNVSKYYPKISGYDEKDGLTCWRMLNGISTDKFPDIKVVFKNNRNKFTEQLVINWPPESYLYLNKILEDNIKVYCLGIVSNNLISSEIGADKNLENSPSNEIILGATFFIYKEITFILNEDKIMIRYNHLNSKNRNSIMPKTSNSFRHKFSNSNSDIRATNYYEGKFMNTQVRDIQENLLSKIMHKLSTDFKNNFSNLCNKKTWNKTIWMTVFSSIIFSSFLILRHRKMLLRSYEEQKMSLFSETAFYFSFYDEIVNSSESIKNIMQKIISDDRTEYPDIINSLSRFNIYQEVILGVLYKLFLEFYYKFKFNIHLIYSFINGEHLLKNTFGFNYLSSEFVFLSTPYNFYFFFVNSLLGIGMGVLCGTSTFIAGGSYISGLTCMGFLFANFRLRLLTRISSLPLRENFALPFIWANNMILISIIRFTNSRNKKKKWILLYFTSVILLEFWQFSVFVISTQILSVYVLFLLGCEHSKLILVLRKLIYINLIATFTSYILHFFNYYILLTPLPQIGVSILLSISICKILFKRGKFSLLYSFTSGIISLALFIIFKLILSPFSDHDTHVFDMLKSAIFGQEFANFDTMIYKMGGSEFSFITKEQLEMIKDSGVLFIFIPGILLILFSIIIDTAKIQASKYYPYDKNIESSFSYQFEDYSQINNEISDSSSNSSIVSTTASHSPESAILLKQSGVHCYKNNLQDEYPKNLKEKQSSCKNKNLVFDKLDNINFENQDTAISFLTFQTIFFCLLAIIISRLRVLALPYIAVVSSLFASRKYLYFILNYYKCVLSWIFRIKYKNKAINPNKRYFNSKIAHFFFFATSIIFLSFSISKFPFSEIQTGLIPENNASSSKSRLIGWINSNLPNYTPILSDMVVSATLRLTTKSKIVTHPQYEHIKIRRRTQFMYSISACISLKELYETMQQQYKTEYLLLSIYRCAFPRGDKNAITVIHVTNFLDNINHRCNNQENIFQRTCWRIQLDSQSRYFDLIYRNAHYSLYKRKPFEDLKLVQTNIFIENKNYNDFSNFSFKRKLLDWNESWKPWIMNHCIINDSFCPQNMVDYARIIIDIYNIIDVSKLLYEKAVSIFPNSSYVIFNYAEFLDYDIGDDPKRIFEKYNMSIELYKQEVSKHNVSKVNEEDFSPRIKLNQSYSLKMILGFILFSEQINGRTEFVIDKSLELILENELIKLILSNFEFMSLARISEYLNNNKIIDIDFDMCIVSLAYNTCMISSYLKTIEIESRRSKIIQKKYPSWLIKTVYNKLWIFSKLLDPNNPCIIKYWNLFHDIDKRKIDFIYSFFLF